MSFSPDQPPTNEKTEVSNPEWENLQEEADSCAALIKEHTDWSSVRSRSMHHLLRNLEGVILLINYKRNKDEKPDRIEYQELQKGVVAIKKYLELLEEFPDFAEKEINSKEGYFPEMWEQLGRAVEGVEAYERALRGEQK